MKTRLQSDQASFVKEQLLSLGGECAVSEVDGRRHEYVDILLAGTVSQLNRLTSRLDEQQGLSALSDDIREVL
ncbi:hypothetical protein, partial [Haloferax profundi]|uniref:hypothetical protein n=1 Tax=Haloferax profundi TaxID=1544718 RepID=UPI001E51A8F1